MAGQADFRQPARSGQQGLELSADEGIASLAANMAHEDFLQEIELVGKIDPAAVIGLGQDEQGSVRLAAVFSLCSRKAAAWVATSGRRIGRSGQRTVPVAAARFHRRPGNRCGDIPVRANATMAGSRSTPSTGRPQIWRISSVITPLPQPRSRMDSWRASAILR